jgi:hypothetical protein
MRKNITIPTTFVYALLCTFFTTNLFAEGSKELLPNAGDELALYCNSNLYYDFASYESHLSGKETQRLNIHISDPDNEQVFIGLSQPHTQGHYPLPSLTSGYFRIRDANGAIVHGPILVDGTSANITSRAEGIAGPEQVVGASGYDAAGDYTFNPDGLAAGDYYIEFNLDASTYNTSHLLFQYFDITVATEANVAINGRVFSQNWTLFAPTIDNNYNGTYGVYDRPVNGSFHVLSNENFVSKIDFNESNFQPAAFNIAVNSWGTKNTGDNYSDRQSLESQKSTIPELKIFLNDPDPIVYPSGTYGEMLTDADYPAIIGCPATGYSVRIAATSSGLVELLLDFNQVSGAGIYDLATEDVLLFFDLVPRAGETAPYIRDISWDGKDGLGAVANTTIPIGTEVSFAQGSYHIPVYDVEFNLDGFRSSITRPSPPPSNVLRFYHDDVNIATGTTDIEAGCDPNTVPATPCHTWADSTYGDINTINTYWYAKQEIEISNITVTTPDCGCAVSGINGINISGMTYNDSDANALKGGSESGSSLAMIDAKLYEDVNNDGLIDGGDTEIETVQTDANGDYDFLVTLSSTTGMEDKLVDQDIDDAEEYTDPLWAGFTFENGATISLGNSPDFFSDTEVGLRFNNINLPQRATITKAEIEFTASGTSASGAPTYNISVEDNTDPDAFSSSNNDITSRPRLGSPIPWAPTTWMDGMKYKTSDITTAVQALVSKAGWVQNNSMVFIISGSTDARKAHSFDGVPANAPKLIIEFDDYGLPKQYLVELDPATFPGGKSLSTDNIEQVNVSTLNHNGCDNYFGFVPPLPVELSHFSAIEDNCNVIVKWTAAIEDNLSHYELEYSENQSEFTTKATFESGLTSDQNSYRYTDESAGKMNYYRLEMVDLDGSIEYSKVLAVSLDCKNKNGLSIYPNPVRSGSPLQVRLQTEDREATLMITNVFGKVVRKLTLSTEMGLNLIKLDVSDLPTGA